MGDLNEVLIIPENTGYWLIRADGGKYYDDFLINHFIAISDNEITIDLIEETEFFSIAGRTLKHYKTLYDLVYGDATQQQISHGASRTHKFMEEMKVGDIVLVPSKRSAHFIIGVITSEPYEVDKEFIESQGHVKYAVNPYFKRRSVHWIKEVSRYEISEKLYWILAAHQTIFDLKQEKDHINQLLSPIYIQGGICHGTLKISKQEGLNSDDWYDLHKVIKRISDKNGEEVFVKSNVQSPGLIEFVSLDPATVISAVFVLSAALFGDVNILGVKFKGIVPSIQAHKKSKIENEILEEEKIAKQIENERSRFELERDKEIWQDERINKEAARVSERLQISSFHAGKTISTEKQMDNVDVPVEVESEITLK